MKVEIALLFNGNCQISDEDDEAPLMTIQFHNELSSLPNGIKIAIGEAAFQGLEAEVLNRRTR